VVPPGLSMSMITAFTRSAFFQLFEHLKEWPVAGDEAFDAHFSLRDRCGA
jgi:hypothetical protein